MPNIQLWFDKTHVGRGFIPYDRTLDYVPYIKLNGQADPNKWPKDAVVLLANRVNPQVHYLWAHGSEIVPYYGLTPSAAPEMYSVFVYSDPADKIYDIKEEDVVKFALGSFVSKFGLQFQNKLSFYSGKDEARKQLTCSTQDGVEFCRETDGKQPASISKEAYFEEGTPLDDKEKAYCRCLAHVAVQQAKGKAANTYAICTKSVRRTGTVECSPYYAFSNWPDAELDAYIRLKYKYLPPNLQKQVTDQMSRTSMLLLIDQYGATK